MERLSDRTSPSCLSRLWNTVGGGEKPSPEVLASVGGAHPVGLRNHVNTCYFNTMLQCLAQTPVLVPYFLAEDWRHDLAQPPNRRGVVQAFSKFLREFHGSAGLGEGNDISPLPLLTALGQHINERDSLLFKNYLSGSRYKGQQCTAEALQVILDWLHEDTDSRHKRPYFARGLLRPDDSSLETSKFYDRVQLYGDSVVSKTLRHLVKDTLSFSDKSTQHTYGADIVSKIEVPKSNTPVTLESILATHYSPESMDDKIKRRDGKFERAKKHLELAECPEVYIIHLARFEHPGKQGEGTKVTTAVRFGERLQLNSLSGKADYELYAVSNHVGGNSLNSGHYFAYVNTLQTGQWYKPDDARVTSLDKRELFSRRAFKSAYVLFYKRVGTKPSEN